MTAAPTCCSGCRMVWEGQEGNSNGLFQIYRCSGCNRRTKVKEA